MYNICFKFSKDFMFRLKKCSYWESLISEGSFCHIFSPINPMVSVAYVVCTRHNNVAVCSKFIFRLQVTKTSSINAFRFRLLTV